VRETDFVARLGGDEFAIVQTGVKSASDVSNSSTACSRRSVRLRMPRPSVTTDASIGIAMAPQDGSDVDQILKNADLAMYAAKAAGRRTSASSNPPWKPRFAPAASWKRLRQAITDGGFEVYYQPCLSLQDDSITGCERCCAGAIRSAA